MIEYITPDRIANSICQDNTFNGTYVLVEGNNDYLLFKKFFKDDVCEIQIAFGKSNVEEAIEIIQQRGYNNTIGIVDADFCNIANPARKNKDLFITDTHDLETLAFQSNALDSLINLYCVEEKLVKFKEEHSTDDLRGAFLNLISPLGYFKWANQQNNWGILFKPKNDNSPELKIEDFISVSTMKFAGYETMVKTVFNFSRGKVVTLPLENLTLNAVKVLSEQEVDKYQLCNGHDLAYLFSLALRKKIANLNSKAVSAAQIERELMLAFDSRHFELTRLYAEIKKWEETENKTILNF